MASQAAIHGKLATEKLINDLAMLERSCGPA
jgi:hypothetical protein